MENIVEEVQEEVKAEEAKHLLDSNFLRGSHIPSIGCFLTLMSFMGSRKQIKELVKGLSKTKGIHFYKSHIKNSTGFSDKEIFSRNSNDVVYIDFKNQLHE